MDESGALSELCDLCGKVLAGGSGLYVLVSDSSFAHVTSAKLDGRRLLTACSDEHLDALEQQYEQRPWRDVELWAGKVAREMHRAQGTLPPAELAERTGLTEDQVHLAVVFHNARAAEIRRRREEG